MKDVISFADFSKLDLRVGEVVEVKEVDGSEKLVELTVDFGPDFAEALSGKTKRTIYAGIKKWYEPASLTGRKLIFVVNLEPKRFKIGDRELVSEGMMVAALRQAQDKAGNDEAVLYTFDKDLEPGTALK